MLDHIRTADEHQRDRRTYTLGQVAIDTKDVFSTTPFETKDVLKYVFRDDPV